MTQYWNWTPPERPQLPMDMTIAIICALAALVVGCWILRRAMQEHRVLRRIIDENRKAQPPWIAPQYSNVFHENRILRFENNRLQRRIEELEDGGHFDIEVHHGKGDGK